MRKIKAIIKRPDEEYGHMTYISDSLENLQRIVGGYIEMLAIDEENVLIVNEEGKLMNLEKNFKIPGDVIVGEVIITGYKDGELTDVTVNMPKWKEWLKRWGN